MNRDDIINAVRLLLATMTADERIEFFDEIKEDYCPACGNESDGYPCYCWRDE
jgi:hypothetical protein